MDLIKESLEGVPDNEKLFYIEKDGKFHLHQKIAEKEIKYKEKEDLINKKNQENFNLKNELKDLKDSKQEPNLMPGKENDINNGKDKTEVAELKNQIAQLIKTNKEKDAQAKQSSLDSKLREACEKVSGTYELLKGVVKLDHTSEGVPCVKDSYGNVVLSEDGSKPMEISNYLNSLKTNDVYKGAFKSQAPSGFGFNGLDSNTQNQKPTSDAFSVLHDFSENKEGFVKAALKKGQKS